MKSIPYSQLIKINPSVIGAGSNPLALNGVMIGKSEKIPVGRLLNFYNTDDVGAWFGTESYEYKLARVYFNGFVGCTKFPSQLFFYAMPTAERGAWAIGSSLKGMLLSQLKAIAGSLKVSINGEEYESSELDLASATSFSDAATRIQGFLGIGSVATVSWDSLTSRFVINVTADKATSEISQITGTASAPLGLDAATRSNGSDAVSITDTLDAIKVLSLNWATFTFIEQLTIPEMTEAALWNNAQNKRYLFVNSDNDPNAKVSGNTENFGVICELAGYEGTANIYDAKDEPLTKAFVMAIAASVDWKATNGRRNFAWREQSGLPTTVDEEAIANNLIANHYSYYGFYGGAGENYDNILYSGEVSGGFQWLDTYLNQIYLNAQIQVTLFKFFKAVGYVPYNAEGYALIRASMSVPIEEALNNGTIQRGVPLDDNQKAQIIRMVGYDVSGELYNNGQYLQIKDADTQTRINRASPPMYFFYSDGGSIQRINLPSIAVL